MAGYDVINKIEVFIKAINPDFELSLENPLTIKLHVNNEIDETITDVVRTSESIIRSCSYIKETSKKMELERDYYGDNIPLNHYLNISIERLQNKSEKLKYISETYFK